MRELTISIGRTQNDEDPFVFFIQAALKKYLSGLEDGTLGLIDSEAITIMDGYLVATLKGTTGQST